MAEGKVQQKIVHTTYPTPKVSIQVAIQYMYYIHTNTVVVWLVQTPNCSNHVYEHCVGTSSKMSVNCQWFQGTPLADHEKGFMLESIKRFDLNPVVFISD